MIAINIAYKAIPIAFARLTGNDEQIIAPSTVPSVQPQAGNKISPNIYSNDNLPDSNEATVNVSSVMPKENISLCQSFVLLSIFWDKDNDINI